MKIRPDLKFTCGSVLYTVCTNSCDFLSCRSEVPVEPGSVRQINTLLWSACWCTRDRSARWGEPKWYVEWEPVDKGYSKTSLVDDILAETRRSLLS